VSLVPRLVIGAIEDLITGSGKNSKVDPKRMAVAASHEPGGTSLTNALHWEKLIRTKNFVQLNGKPYNIKNLSTLTDWPMLIFHSKSDWLANPKDFAILRQHLPKQAIINEIDGWGHLDFVWSENSGKLQNNQVAAFINNINKPVEM